MMVKVTIIGSHNHVGSQAPGKVRHRLVNVFLWQHLIPGGLQPAGRLSAHLSPKLKMNIYCLTADHESAD